MTNPQADARGNQVHHHSDHHPEKYEPDYAHTHPQPQHVVVGHIELQRPRVLKIHHGAYHYHGLAEAYAHGRACADCEQEVFILLYPVEIGKIVALAWL